MNKDCISKDLSLWLKEMGCDVESDYLWMECENTSSIAPGRPVPHRFSEFGTRDDLNFRLNQDHIRVISHAPAYSWLDILVHHAKEFWSQGQCCYYCGCEEDRFCCPDHHSRGCGTTTQDYRTQKVLAFLQQSKFQEAEDYVREHSVFNNPPQ